MKNNWFLEKLRGKMKSIKISSKVAPIISGGAALILLNKIIFSSLDELKFISSLIAVLLLFFMSVILYYFLSRLEKDKDVYLLSVIGRTVGDVFKRYGQQMAVSNADHAKAEDMNKIMQTIVNLVKNMKNLSDKKYKD